MLDMIYKTNYFTTTIVEKITVVGSEHNNLKIMFALKQTRIRTLFNRFEFKSTYKDDMVAYLFHDKDGLFIDDTKDKLYPATEENLLLQINDILLGIKRDL